MYLRVLGLCFVLSNFHCRLWIRETGGMNAKRTFQKEENSPNPSFPHQKKRKKCLILGDGSHHCYSVAFILWIPPSSFFLFATHSSFIIPCSIRLFPHYHDSGGFFVAVFKKTGPLRSSGRAVSFYLSFVTQS